MKVDILAIAAHPDDVELACAGTILKHIEQGYTVGIVDLTQGELGTRGSAEIRHIEASNSAQILGVKFRNNLNLGDGFFEENEATLKAIITQIRAAKPKIVLANSLKDRHPDHGRASALISRACFLAGLPKIETSLNNVPQEAHRPKATYFYIQDYNIGADFIVDITAQYDKKLESILAFKSQFYDPNSPEPNTPISSKEFISFLEGRALEYGRLIGVKYGEGFKIDRPIGIENLMQTL
jgi:bacillithiol biosynthesis deacetylase BshB1